MVVQLLFAAAAKLSGFFRPSFRPRNFSGRSRLGNQSPSTSVRTKSAGRGEGSAINEGLVPYASVLSLKAGPGAELIRMGNYYPGLGLPAWTKIFPGERCGTVFSKIKIPPTRKPRFLHDMPTYLHLGHYSAGGFIAAGVCPHFYGRANFKKPKPKV